LNQVLQEFEEMNTLGVQFEEMMAVQVPAKIQMAVRIGSSKKPFNLIADLWRILGRLYFSNSLNLFIS